MESSCCPICQNNFEYPKRHLVRDDDLEYLNVPRVLPCLHTCCQSCLEAMRQKNDDGTIVCPICRDSSNNKGIRYLPLDGPVLAHLLEEDATSMMSFCANCHDEVEAVGWCTACSTALCDFHMQDHAQSLATSRHTVHTLKEIAEHKYRIKPTLPPIACPEVSGSDCSIFCHSCHYLISPQAMVDYHSNHRCDDCPSVLAQYKSGLSSATSTVEDRKSDLSDGMDTIKKALERLDNDLDNSVSKIMEQMEACRTSIAAREKALLDRLQSISNEKRSILQSQLNEIAEAFEDCKQFLAVAETTGKLSTIKPLGGTNTSTHLNHTSNSAKLQGNGGPRGPYDGLYLISAAPSIMARSKVIVQQSSNLSMKPLVDPGIRITFLKSSMEICQAMFAVQGAVYHHYNHPPKGVASELLREVMPIEGSAAGASTGISEDKNGSKASEGLGLSLESKEQSTPLESAPMLAADAKPVETHQNSNSHPIALDFFVKMSPTVSVDHPTGKFSKEVQAVVVEVRQKTHRNFSAKLAVDISSTNSEKNSVFQSGEGLEEGEGDEEDLRMIMLGRTRYHNLQQKKYVESVKSVHEEAIDASQGELLGRVVLVTEADAKLLYRHEMRTLFENDIHAEDQLPLIRVTKEMICL